MHRRLSGFEESYQDQLDLHANDIRPIQSTVKPSSQRAGMQASFRVSKLDLPLLLNCVYRQVFMGEGRMKKAWSSKDNTK
jgi:hypothetical protein